MIKVEYDTPYTHRLTGKLEFDHGSIERSPFCFHAGNFFCSVVGYPFLFVITLFAEIYYVYDLSKRECANWSLGRKITRIENLSNAGLEALKASRIKKLQQRRSEQCNDFKKAISDIYKETQRDNASMGPSDMQTRAEMRQLDTLAENSNPDELIPMFSRIKKEIEIRAQNTRRYHDQWAISQERLKAIQAFDRTLKELSALQSCTTEKEIKAHFTKRSQFAQMRHEIATRKDRYNLYYLFIYQIPIIGNSLASSSKTTVKEALEKGDFVQRYNAIIEANTWLKPYKG